MFNNLGASFNIMKLWGDLIIINKIIIIYSPLYKGQFEYFWKKNPIEFCYQGIFWSRF